MHGPPRTPVDLSILSEVSGIFGRVLDEQYAAAQIATMLLALKPGERVCIERGGEYPQGVFTIITKGTVNLDDSGS